MTDYEYTSITTAPNIPAIADAVADSAMTDKNMNCGNWEEDTEILTIVWDGTLGAGDKTILDGLVSTHKDDPESNFPKGTCYSSYSETGDENNQVDIGVNGISLVGTAKKYKLLEKTARDLYGISGTFNGLSCTGADLASLIKWLGYAFDDGSGAVVAESAITNFVMPTDYEDGTDYKIIVNWAAAATSGDVSWGIGSLHVGEGENLNGTETYQTAVDTVAGTTWYKNSFEVTFDGTGCVAGDDIAVILYRHGDDSSDTMSGDAFVPSVVLKYISNKIGE